MSTCGTQDRDEKPAKGIKKDRTRKHCEDELFLQLHPTAPLAALDEYDNNYPMKKIAKGAKLAAAMKHINKWQEEAPEDKIIGMAVADTDAVGLIASY